tara:strand:+ start:210 stop:473 length:264 start_codon:yes stop_codon:yes gene_type:complete
MLKTLRKLPLNISFSKEVLEAPETLPHLQLILPEFSTDAHGVPTFLQISRKNKIFSASHCSMTNPSHRFHAAVLYFGNVENLMRTFS